MADRFNFEHKTQPQRVSVPVNNEVYGAMLAIAVEYGLTVPYVAARILEAGFEEYKKEHTIPPAPEPEWKTIDRALCSERKKQ